MKVAISYPPLESGFGVPLLAQNRQFQWFKNPTYIYPVVPATAATLLAKDGFKVIWDDAVAEGLSYSAWLERIAATMPALVAIETKTPVVKKHWEIVRDIKTLKLAGGPPLVVLMGDHVTAFPQESMENSPVDFVLTGGDYDLLLRNLCRHISNPEAEQLEPGIWFRKDGEVISTGKFNLDHDMAELPPIDRELTKWKLYSEKNGNFKRLPGTYTMFGRDCWWGKCTFCSWTTLYPRYRVRPVTSALDEVGKLVERYGVREIMDDTGSFPTGKWLREFCNGMIERGYNRRVTMDCNMRFGALKKPDFWFMKEAGFRLLLFGLESANQSTLDRLDKGVTLDAIVDTLTNARAAGLYPHITIMFGYPWETYEEAMRTIEFGRWLLKKGLAWTVQATVIMPYPGTPLFEYCRENGHLTTDDWDHFDMRGPVIKTLYSKTEAAALVQKIYSTAFNPEFIVRRFLGMRDIDDVRYILRGTQKVFGHLVDFKGTRKARACDAEAAAKPKHKPAKGSTS